MSERFSDIRLNKSTQSHKITAAPEWVTPEWVSRVLQRNNVGREVQVSGVEVILRRELQVSTAYRLGIRYAERMDGDCPRSLFLKLAHGLSEDTRVPGSDDHAEAEFYRTLAPRIGCPPLVRCYDAGYSEETRRSHILLEDLTDTHSQPEQNHAPSTELSQLAIKALAKAHAAWWKVPAAGTRPNLETENLVLSDRYPVVSNLCVPVKHEFDIRNFSENLKKSVVEFLNVTKLPADQIAAYKLLLDSAPQIWGRLKRVDHLTVTHGDMHWWNFLYPKDPRMHSVRVFDWHLWHIDLGARDLAFLLALGGFAEPRPEIEAQLLSVYHEALVDNGVVGYSREMLMDDYRWSAIRNLNIPVIFQSQGKHRSTWQTALRRAFDAFDRLECRELLKD